MSDLKLSNLEAFRILELKPKGGSWSVVNPDNLIGSATVKVDTGLINEVVVTLQDEGIPADQEIGGIEYPRMNPRNLGTMRCRFSYGYVESPSTTRQMYEGYLKEISPSFPDGKPPRVEMVFQCAGWEFTRVERNHTYPHIDQKEVPEVTERKIDAEYELDPTDRSWASRTEVDDTIRLEDIIRNIIEAYGYEVEIKLPDPELEVSGESPLRQSNQSDWAFLKQLAEKYGFGIYSDVVKEEVGESDDPRSIFKWFIVPEKDITDTQQNDEVEFWWHQAKGERLTEYDPTSKSKFILKSSPDITVNSNWAYQPELVKETNEEGEDVYRLSTVDENNEVVVYELKESMLQGDQADKYFTEYVQGNAGWQEARKFFKKKAVQHGNAKNVGQNRATFQGVEVSFSTAGNPLAQIGMSYPIKGLGSFYSRNLTLMSMTHTIDTKWETSYNFKLL